MNELSQPTTPPTPRPQGFWPLDHLILPLIMPVAAIRGPWRRASLPMAYFAHFYGLVIAGLAFVAIDLFLGYLSATMQETSDYYYYYDYYESFVWSLLSGDVDARDHALVTLAPTLIFIELFYLFAAFATICWSASPERFRSSYRQSLTRWYQLTVWQAPFGVGIMTIFYAMESGFFFDRESFFFITGSIITVCSLLVLSVTLRGLAVRRREDGWAACCAWPMNCEGCGYALTMQSLDQSCPECGKPVGESAEFSRGRLIELKPMQALILGATQPSRIGQWMLAHRPMPGAGKVLARSVSLMMLATPLGIMIVFATVAIISGEDLSGADLDEIVRALFYAFLFTAAPTALGMTGIALLLASVVGTFHRIVHKRQAMHVAGMAAGYLSGVLPIWLLGNWLAFGFFVGMVASSFTGGGAAWMAMIPMIWFVSNLAFAVLYMLMVGRVLRATRWANV